MLTLHEVRSGGIAKFQRHVHDGPKAMGWASSSPFMHMRVLIGSNIERESLLLSNLTRVRSDGAAVAANAF